MHISALRTAQQMFCLLELDRAPMLAEAMGLSISDPTHKVILDSLMKQMVELYSPHVSGIVLSPEHSFQHAGVLDVGCAPILSMERKAASVDPMMPPTFVDNWSIENIANNYAVAKLELYYHPSEAQAALKKQMVAEIYDYCKYEGIDFILELLVYHAGSEKPSLHNYTESQLVAVQEFRESCDLLALEYLGDSLSAVTITAELDIPWIMTMRELEYDQCKRELRASLESGAQGFLIGDVFWPRLEPAVAQKGQVDVQVLEQEIAHQSRDRVLELVRITTEFGTKEAKKE